MRLYHVLTVLHVAIAVFCLVMLMVLLLADRNPVPGWGLLVLVAASLALGFVRPVVRRREGGSERDPGGPG